MRARRSISRADRRRARDDVAADDDEAHLHGERDQAPEAVAERLRRPTGDAPSAIAATATMTTRKRRENIGVGNPALRPGAAAQRDAFEL